jgi:hypothetical protein
MKVFDGFPDHCEIFDMLKGWMVPGSERCRFGRDDFDVALFADGLDLGFDVAFRNLRELFDNIHDAKRLHDSSFAALVQGISQDCVSEAMH